MPTVIENLNSIITTKNEIAGILSENGVDAGNVFSNYPSYIRSVIGSGGGTDKVSYAYLAEQLSYYVSKEDLSSQSYITYNYLDNVLNSYVTYSYLYSYVGAVCGDVETLLANI